MYNYNARLYDPGIGIFLTADTVVPGGGYDSQLLNRYAYVRNNPLKYIDPSGHRLDDPYNLTDDDFMFHDNGSHMSDSSVLAPNPDKDRPNRNKWMIAGKNNYKTTYNRGHRFSRYVFDFKVSHVDILGNWSYGYYSVGHGIMNSSGERGLLETYVTHSQPLGFPASSKQFNRMIDGIYFGLAGFSRISVDVINIVLNDVKNAILSAGTYGLLGPSSKTADVVSLTLKTETGIQSFQNFESLSRNISKDLQKAAMDIENSRWGF